MLFFSFVDQSSSDPHNNSPPDYYELFPGGISSHPPDNAPAVPISLATPTDPVRSSAAMHSSSFTTIRYPVVTAVVTQPPTVTIPVTTPTDPVRSSAMQNSSFETIRHPPVNAIVTYIPPSRSHLCDIDPVNEVCLVIYLC